jgi:hypothetical protein
VWRQEENSRSSWKSNEFLTASLATVRPVPTGDLFFGTCWDSLGLPSGDVPWGPLGLSPGVCQVPLGLSPWGCPPGVPLGCPGFCWVNVWLLAPLIQPKNYGLNCDFICGPGRDRTCDQGIMSPLL